MLIYVSVIVQCLALSHSFTLCDPVDCSSPGSSVHGILWQEYWSGLTWHPPVALPDSGMESASLLHCQVDFSHCATWETVTVQIPLQFHLHFYF